MKERNTLSLCLLIQEVDRIILAADSREAIKINGELFATGTEGRKIRVIGSQVFFTTGNASVAENILGEYERSGIYTIDNLQTIKEKYVKKYVDVYGERHFNSGYNLSQVVGFVIAQFRNGKSEVYAISSGDSEVFKSIGDNIRVADGSRSNEALQLLTEYEKNGGTDLIEGYRNVYNSLADEGIGGTLSIFLIDSKGIRHTQYPIQDSREIKIAPAELVWSREHGIVVQRSDGVARAQFNSDEIYFEVEGEKQFWLDIPNKTMKFSGHLEAASGTFQGDLSAAGGTFTGTLVGVDGSFSGTIEAATIIGGIITGANINGGVITGSVFSGGAISIGSGNSIFRADSSGVWLGNTDFASAPFKVSPSGHMTATGAHLSGGSLTGAANINVTQSATIGHKLFINPISFLAGVDFGSGVEVYHDPVTLALHLKAPGGVYANFVRIDQ